MTKLTVLYGIPTDPAAFDEHYRSVHAPLAKKIPNLEGFAANRVIATADGSAPQHHLVAELVFKDMATFGASMGSPEGKAAADDVANFATGGVVMLISEDL